MAKYVTNKQLLPEIKKSKQQGQMTSELAEMLMLMTRRYAAKSNFSQYSYKEELEGDALVHLVRVWDQFDEERGSNPFAFYTQCIKNSFNQTLNKEKKQRDIRDRILVEEGQMPSFAYQAEDKPPQSKQTRSYYKENKEKILRRARERYHAKKKQQSSRLS